MGFLKNVFQNLTGSPVSGARSMVNSYLRFRQAYPGLNEKLILCKTLESRYPEMNEREIKEWVNKYRDIKSLTYSVLIRECGIGSLDKYVVEISEIFDELDKKKNK